MILSELKIKFNGPLILGDKINVYYNDGVEKLSAETIVTTRVAYGDFELGANTTDQATKYAFAMNADYGVDFTITQLDNVVTLTPIIGPLEMLFDSTSENVEFISTSLGYNVKSIRVRSPYILVNSSEDLFSSTKFEIASFTGDMTAYEFGIINYIKTKNKLTPTQNNIWINPSNLFREKLYPDITKYRDNDTIVAVSLNPNECKWGYIQAKNQLNGVDLTKTTKSFFYIVDGYIEPNEKQGLPRLLISGRKRKTPRLTRQRLHFCTKGLISITYIIDDGLPVTISFNNIGRMVSQDYYQSIRVTTNFQKYALYEFTYEDDFENYEFNVERMYYETYNECKYELIDLVFKNKYGVLETLPMNKKMSKSLSVQSNDYLRGIVDIEGNVNSNIHTNKQFNTIGNEEWILNTDNLEEYWNEPIKELMLSEEMWVIDFAGNITPVLRVDDNIDFKTQLNDKLIQYTLKVKLSNNVINNIQ